jgi:aryl-alcohol dehydrogenase-like predicted oxidoreductase
VRRVPLGALEVSVIGLGCNNFGRALDQEGTTAVVNAALDAGVNFFDTSDNYGDAQSERFLGEALGSRRSEVVIATKFGQVLPGVLEGGARPEYIRSAVTRSLRELGTDYIDLYQLHWPDPETPIGDTLETMWSLVEQGLVREVGCCNLDAGQLDEALAWADERGRPRFVSDQIEYSLLHREPQTNGLTELALDRGVSLLPYYPLTSGLLTGKAVKGRTPEGRLSMDRYQRFLTDRNYGIVDRLRAFAAARELSMVQVALGWLVAQPEVPAVTPGATRPEQVFANAAAAEWIPGPDDLAELDGIAAA